MNEELAREHLLAPVRRWTYSRKYWLIHGVKLGIVTEDEALAAHAITAEEWAEWKSRYMLDGVAGLRVTKRPFER